MADQADKPALSGRPRQRSWARRIIMPLIILAFAAALIYYGREQEDRHHEEVETAVRDLIHEVAASPVARPTPGPVAQRLNVSPGTLEQLVRAIEAQPAGLPGLDVAIESGDADPPFGDGRASHRAYILVQGRAEIALRLHHPGDSQRIEVLGYWIP